MEHRKLFHENQGQTQQYSLFVTGGRELLYKTDQI